MDLDELSQQWIEESKAYVRSINAYVDKGLTEGWDTVGDEPEDTREALAEQVLHFIREFNRGGNIAALRSKFPPASDPFHKYIKEGGQGLSSVSLLDDGRILVRIGASYEQGRVVEIDHFEIKERPEIINFGCSSNRVFYAVAKKDGIQVHKGWDGPVVAEFKWPTGLEDLPPTMQASPLDSPLPVTQLLPFPDGQGVLLVSSVGLYLLTENAPRRLLPDLEQIEMEYEETIDEQELDGEEGDIGADQLLSMDMEHGAISYSGEFIAVGHQSSSHLIFNRDGHLLGDVGHLSEYPHYAIFSSDDEMLALNSCHFYNGMTIGFPLKLLPNVDIPPYDLDPRCVELNDGARVYVGLYRKGEFIIGDALGYLRAFDKNGSFKWQHYIGSTITAMDVSDDGKTLAVTSYAGLLCLLNLDTGEQDPFTIGTATHKEFRRWLFWKTEQTPLAW